MSLDPITLAVAQNYTDKKIQEAQLGGNEIEIPDKVSELENDLQFVTMGEISILANQLKEEIKEDIFETLPRAEQAEF